MERRELKLVGPEKRAPLPSRLSRSATMALGGVVLGAALLGTALGADAARATWRPRDLAAGALDEILRSGSEAPGVRSAAVSLRRRIGESPLDARTRGVYASLLVELAERPSETRAAAFHARRAAALAPVTVPVVGGAALVLARCQEVEEALALARAMFAYDPSAAADLLADLEPYAAEGGLEDALPQDPSAWLAWWTELRRSGRDAEAEAHLEKAFARWPDHLPTVAAMADRAVARRDWTTLGRILPHGPWAVGSPIGATILAYRARWRAETGDAAGARADAEEAARHAGSGASILTLAGDAMAATNATDRARQLWTRALHGLPKGDRSRSTRAGLWTRLARLEERHGKPADAIRAWRAVADADPGNAEARRRLDDLSGFHR